jgi:Na+-translocating ferredoxin:NAD+ oxidoreductase RnfA subunit
MIVGNHVVGASLIALLVDRLVLERRLGTTPFSATSSKFSMTIGYALPALIVLAISSLIASALVRYALQPLGAAHLYPVLFAAAVVATALAGELLLPKWLSPELRNRVSGRTAVMVMILGFLVMVPQGTADPLSCGKNVCSAAATGIVFFIVTLLWNGIREKVELGSIDKKPLSPAQELVVAGLLALVLQSIAGLSFFHR